MRHPLARSVVAKLLAVWVVAVWALAGCAPLAGPAPAPEAPAQEAHSSGHHRGHSHHRDGREKFPPYFGENWDALDECLADLEWLPADAYVLVVLNAAELLDKDRPEARRTFWEVLEGAAREWAQPVSGQGARPPRPFRVLLQCTREEEERVRAHWPAAAAQN
jgi:hypothetical protein